MLAAGTTGLDPPSRCLYETTVQMLKPLLAPPGLSGNRLGGWWGGQPHLLCCPSKPPFSASSFPSSVTQSAHSSESDGFVGSCPAGACEKIAKLRQATRRLYRQAPPPLTWLRMLGWSGLWGHLLFHPGTRPWAPAWTLQHWWGWRSPWRRQPGS